MDNIAKCLRFAADCVVVIEIVCARRVLFYVCRTDEKSGS